MFLVKSCKEKHNIFNSKNLRIGTLLEYRETESEQIADKEEGFFNINLEIKNKFVDIDLFNAINTSHNSFYKINGTDFQLHYFHENTAKIDFNGVYNWVNFNRFIFCLSKLEQHEDSTSIFPDYDDYWFINYFTREKLIRSIESALLQEVIINIQNGNQIFDKKVNDFNNLTIKSHFQEIIYSSRTLCINNQNIDSMKSNILGLFNDIKFIKPEKYKPENEFRIVFDFYEDDIFLSPIVKNLIIPDSFSHLIKKSSITS